MSTMSKCMFYMFLRKKMSTGIISILRHGSDYDHGFVMGLMLVSILLESILFCHRNRLFFLKFSFNFLNTTQVHGRVIGLFLTSICCT